jgi:hypothetical protein
MGETISAAVAMLAAFAIQQVVEVVDIFFLSALPEDSIRRKKVLKLVSLTCGFVVAAGCRDCGELLASFPIHASVKYLLVSFALAGGTEGMNSLLKYAKYSKENKKADAAASRAMVAPLQIQAIAQK